MRPALTRRLCLVLTALLSQAGLVLVAPMTAGGAEAAAPSAAPVKIALRGTLLSAGEDGARAYAVALPGGDVVPVRGVRTPVGGRAHFEGTVRLPAPVVERLAAQGIRPRPGSTLAAREIAGREALALVDAGSATLSVEQADLTPLAAVAAPVTHDLHLAAPSNLGALSLTDAQILDRVGQAERYWKGQAEGRIIDFVPPTKVKHYVSTVPSADNGCGLTTSFFDVVEEAAAQFPGIDIFAGPDQLAVVVPTSVCGGGALGMGSVGDSFADGGGLVLLDDPAQFDSTMGHEMGHNYGFGHSNIATCGGSCISEYGGIFDVMGYGIAAHDQTTALSTPFRIFQAITQAGEVERLPFTFGEDPESFTRTIGPRSSATGLRSLRVLDPDDGEDFYLDYRSGTGEDTGSAYSASYDLFTMDGSFAFRPGVTRVQQQGNESVVLPSGSDASMAPGDTWTNESGTLSITVGVMDAEGATVTVRWTPGSALTRVADLETTGEFRPGGMVAVDPYGKWDSAYLPTVQWLRDGTEIPGETFDAYLVGLGDVGHQISVRVTAWGWGMRPDSQTTTPVTVQLAQFETSAGPTLSGTPHQGSTLTALAGSWSPVDSQLTTRWEWQANLVAIPGAPDSRTFALTSLEFGKKVRACQVLSAPGYQEERICSTETTPVIGTLTVAKPLITGKVRVGRTLTARPGTWTTGTAFSYRWFADGVAIPKATKSKLLLPKTVRGKRITVKVTGRKTGYTTITKTSAATVRVAR